MQAGGPQQADQAGEWAPLLDGLALPSAADRTRLSHVRELIAGGAVSVLSFDVFDTLLWRSVPRPTDAFILLGEALLAEGALSRWVDPYVFRMLRIEAEKASRRLKEASGAGVEVTLEEIWAQFPAHALAEGGRQLGPSREVDIELQVTRPALDLVELASFARDHGCRIIVVSNTYLSRMELAQLICRPGMEVLHDVTIFASSAYGVGKASGLWDIVVDELGVPASRIVHVGDERPSDVDAPTELGITALHIPRASAELEEILVREGVRVPEPSSPVGVFVDRTSGDFGLTGIRSKVDARLATSSLSGDLATSWRYGATVLGPVLTGFSEWVHRWAEEKIGKGPLYCMMREGEFLSDLINRVASARGSGLQAVPIWMSRHLTARASIEEVDEATLRRLALRRVPLTVEQFVNGLGLKLVETPELRDIAGRTMDDGHVVNRVVWTIAASSQLRARVLDESAAVRRRLVRYLESTLSEDADPLVLVDLGWGGTIQAQLEKALSLAGIRRRVVGLYLSMNHVAVERVVAGSEMIGYLSSCGVPDPVAWQISRSPEVLEQVCSATSGSVVDFDDDGAPVLDASVPPPLQVVSKVVAQHGARAFQEEWLRYEYSVHGWPTLDGREAPILAEILRKSISHPTVGESRAFGAWRHDDNLGTTQSEQIVSEHLGPFVPYLSPPDVVDMTALDCFWPQGLTGRHDPALTAAANAIMSGAVPKEVFEGRRDPNRAYMWLDSGQGFGEAQEHVLRTNGSGLSYLHFQARHDDIQTIRFAPSSHSSVFRIDWIDLSCTLAGSGREWRYRITEEAQLAGLVYANCQRLFAGVAIGSNGQPTVHVPVAGVAPDRVTAVDLKVALAVLPIPPGPSLAVPAGDTDLSLMRLAARARAEMSTGGPRAAARGALRVARRALRPR